MHQDKLRTKPTTKAYRKGWERIWKMDIEAREYLIKLNHEEAQFLCDVMSRTYSNLLAEDFVQMLAVYDIVETDRGWTGRMSAE